MPLSAHHSIADQSTLNAFSLVTFKSNRMVMNNRKESSIVSIITALIINVNQSSNPILHTRTFAAFLNETKRRKKNRKQKVQNKNPCFDSNIEWFIVICNSFKPVICHRIIDKIFLKYSRTECECWPFGQRKKSKVRLEYIEIEEKRRKNWLFADWCRIIQWTAEFS